MATEEMAFGAALRDLRLSAGLTQERLAERAGVSAKAIIALENDPARTPRLETVTRLADALGLNPDGRASLLAAARPADAAPARPDPREHARAGHGTGAGVGTQVEAPPTRPAGRAAPAEPVAPAA